MNIIASGLGPYYVGLFKVGSDTSENYDNPYAADSIDALTISSKFKCIHKNINTVSGFQQFYRFIALEPGSYFKVGTGPL